ncbi:MAG: hypothetical protein Tsb009_38210 [Planctomycetaceae bacterium]
MFRPFLTFTIVLSATSVLAAEETKTWRGTWRNKRYNTTGPLSCTATTTDGGKTWTAKFEGLFKREKFSYNVKFTGRKFKGRTLLKGTATLDGDRYQWAGYIRGNTLYGQFKSLKRYYGFFSLKEASR